MMNLASRQPVPLGPRGLPLLGSLLDMSRDPLEFLCQLADHFAPVCQVRLGPGVANVVSSPELIEKVLVGEAQAWVKERTTREFVPILGRGLFTTEGDVWRRQRKLVANAFQPRRVARHAETIVSCARQRFGAFADGELRNFNTDIMALSLEVLSKTLFGISKEQDTQRIAHAMELAFPYFEERIFTWRGIFPPWISAWQALGLRAARREIDDVVSRLIKESRVRGEEDISLLGYLVQVRDEKGRELSEQELRDQAVTFMAAGHEPTAIAILFAVYLLCRHPDRAETLRAELDRVVGTRPLTYEDLAQLPYLDAVVKETLRIYPVSPILGREVITPFELGGYTMEKGCRIIVSPYAMHHNRDYFPFPDRFLPERWLDGLAKRLPRFAYFPFGGGPRVCIGNHFATMEAALLLGTLVQLMTFEVPADFRMELLPRVTLRSRHDLSVRVQHRFAAA